jgi:hypothetical protein
MKKTMSLIFFLFLINTTFSQVKDTINYKLNLKSIAIPVSIMVIGLSQIGHESEEVQVYLQKDFPFFKSRLDNVAQYIPLSAVLFSGTLGLQPKHGFKLRLIYSTISYASMGLTVNVLKKIVTETRPDNSGNNSFPSGHTAFSFTGAEIFHQELKEIHPYLSYAGYPLATGVGIYRMLNNKHYLSDVLVGASIGILSAKFAYAIYQPKSVTKKDRIVLNFAPSSVLGKNGFTFSARF